MVFSRHRDGGYGFVAIDHLELYEMDPKIVHGLLQAVSWAETEGLERVILVVNGQQNIPVQIQDIDIGHSSQMPHLSNVLNKIEASNVPWIAALYGRVLADMAELILACHYRVIHPRGVIEFSQVNWGHVPVAGATQRLPRLIGVERALDIIPTGKTILAMQARELGLVDEIDDDPAYFAGQINTACANAAAPVGVINTGLAFSGVFATARQTTRAMMPQEAAPLKAIDLIEFSQSAHMDAVLAAEQDAFQALQVSGQVNALHHVLNAKQINQSSRWLQKGSAHLNLIAVVGGSMGGVQLAKSMLPFGLRVVIIEADPERALQIRADLTKIKDENPWQKKISQAQGTDQQPQWTVTDNAAAAKDAALVLVTGQDSLENQISTLGHLEAVAHPDAIFATTNEGLDIRALAVGLSDPSKCIGMRFSGPAAGPNIIEIVPAAPRSQRALAVGFALAKVMDQIPILTGMGSNVISRRILTRYNEAADTVLMEGSTPWEVDEAMVDFGYTIGPYEAQDMVGLDIAYADRRRQDATRDLNRRYIPIQDRMIELGKLGKKTGAGWYRYPGGGGKVDDPIVADLAIEEAYFAKITRCDYSADEIRHRLLLAMINEAAHLLFEGIATSARDIDLVTVFGLGFPRMRGGLLYYADTLGASKVVNALRTLCEEDPVAWAPSPLIEHCAIMGIPLAKWQKKSPFETHGD